jgi:hypothetical protein
VKTIDISIPVVDRNVEKFHKTELQFSKKHNTIYHCVTMNKLIIMFFHIYVCVCVCVCVFSFIIIIIYFFMILFTTISLF